MYTSSDLYHMDRVLESLMELDRRVTDLEEQKKGKDKVYPYVLLYHDYTHHDPFKRCKVVKVYKEGKPNFIHLLEFLERELFMLPKKEVESMASSLMHEGVVNFELEGVYTLTKEID